MRTLTAKQKRLLDIWIADQKRKGKQFTYNWDVSNDPDFSGEIYKLIDSLNPCEIFYQNVNNYVQEKGTL